MKATHIGPLISNPAVNPDNRPDKASPEGFGKILKNFIGEVDRKQVEADNKIQSQILNDNEDLHDIMIALEKAKLSFKLLLQLRNKVMEAYKEIVRLSM